MAEDKKMELKDFNIYMIEGPVAKAGSDDEAEATAKAEEMNTRAHRLGIKARYEVIKA